MSDACKDVVCYYVPVPGLDSDKEQRPLIALWKRSWEKYGWTATVLEEVDVRGHPRFEFFNQQFRAKPGGGYGTDYITAVFMRWLAAAHYAKQHDGAVMLVDYDVMNYGFVPAKIAAGTMKIYCDEHPLGIFMGAVLGSAQHFLDIAELFAAWKPDELDYNNETRCIQQDDLSMLLRMFWLKTRPKPDWFLKVPGCALFDYPSWKTSALVHYGYAMKRAGYWPKCDFVEKIRPF